MPYIGMHSSKHLHYFLEAKFCYGIDPEYNSKNGKNANQTLHIEATARVLQSHSVKNEYRKKPKKD